MIKSKSLEGHHVSHKCAISSMRLGSLYFFLYMVLYTKIKTFVGDLELEIRAPAPINSHLCMLSATR